MRAAEEEEAGREEGRERAACIWRKPLVWSESVPHTSRSRVRSC